ncbi:MAG: hypothetical protein UZ17_ACD001002410 [Acidobacteria bacterium OLB17]|nr:MAG: hypothetical protein UZ17_ACD001002410 [Acidobacteria bacterium OLB17]MCZ2392122.1 hypothetical protein [Acidobacteriota bacterium]
MFSRSVVNLFLAGALLALLTLACYRYPPPGWDQYEEMEAIPIENVKERKEKFDSYTVDQQLDLYWVVKNSNACCFEDVTDYVMNNCDYYAPLIIERLSTKYQGAAKPFFLHTLSNMDYYDACVTSKPDLMKKLEDLKEKILPDDSETIRDRKQLINDLIDSMIAKARNKT